mmetsp:Transcript_63399/g.183655  ORF Transcript_63399/g.183655 Transcript_63399/m.183655 type:complete len:214 (-) Transcript_63399:388-1029(-)
MSGIGRSLKSSPNGCSNSAAMKFMLHKENTEMKVTTEAQRGSLLESAATTGVRRLWKTNITKMSCVYGNGNGNSAIFWTSFAFTIPRDSSWNTRVKIGGGTGITFVRMLSTMSLRIHCSNTSHRSWLCMRNCMLLSSRPDELMISILLSLTRATCCKAEQYNMLIKRTNWCWNLTTSVRSEGSGVQKAKRLLAALSHSPRTCMRSVAPSQYRE